MKGGGGCADHAAPLTTQEGGKKMTKNSRAKPKAKMTTKTKPKSAKKTKRPLTDYFKVMLDAKDKDLDSFEYKGKTYVKNTGKNDLVVYTEKSKFDKKSKK
jgi:hypothetical protein